MKSILYFSFIFFGLLFHGAVHALSADEAVGLASGATEDRLKVLAKVMEGADDKAATFIKALSDDNVKILDRQVFMVLNGKSFDPVTGQEIALPENAEDVVSNNRMRGEIDAALSALSLFSNEDSVRLKSIKEMIKDPDPSRLGLIQKALASEKNEKIKSQIEFAIAAIEINDEDLNTRAKAIKLLSGNATPETVRLLNDRLQAESDENIKTQIKDALKQIQGKLAWGEKLGTLFTGLSLGSILLLVALGLAITYGLMGVINMAHGELMMLGAYATYVVQAFFQHHFPQWFDAYLPVAVVFSFLTSAAVGAILERVILKHLYGRPLETLLATWGISLMLMQGVRSIFGAQNVTVENPVWMSGGIEVLSNLTLPWNRIVIIFFAAFVLIAMSLLIGKTRLGLFVRGVTQNRPMASSLGVNTNRVDTYAFALGSGIAGMAGCALSQIGNVGPDLGQSYIVDSFMVVVLGGVGQLLGSVYAAVGLGVLNKLLEGVAGAVLAKITVLVFIVIFIQKRPQGLFAMKGRSAES